MLLILCQANLDRMLSMLRYTTSLAFVGRRGPTPTPTESLDARQDRIVRQDIADFEAQFDRDYRETLDQNLDFPTRSTRTESPIIRPAPRTTPGGFTPS